VRDDRDFEPGLNIWIPAPDVKPANAVRRPQAEKRKGQKKKRETE